MAFRKLIAKTKFDDILKLKNLLKCVILLRLKDSYNYSGIFLGNSRSSFNSLLKVCKLALLVRARGREFHKFVARYKKRALP